MNSSRRGRFRSSIVFCLLCVSVSLWFNSSSRAADKPLEVGFGEADVTPKVGGATPVYMAGFGKDRVAAKVHDPLMARAVVLKHDGKKVALVAVDLVGFFRESVVRV